MTMLARSQEQVYCLGTLAFLVLAVVLVRTWLAKCRTHARFIWSGQVAPVKLPLPEPIKYRPFKWGAYNVTMAISYVGFQDWITLDRDYVRYFTLRRWRMARSGADSVRVLPSKDGGNALAVQELADEVAAYISTKYPTLFHYDPKRSELKLSDTYRQAIELDHSAPRAGAIKNCYALGTAKECLDMVGSVVPDDVLLLRPDPDQGGQYVLIGGITCTAGTWRLKDKIGMTLAQVHESGDVPQYHKKLKPGMDKLFARIQPGSLVARSNYGFQVVRNQAHVEPHELAHLPYDPNESDVAEAAWSTTGFGPEDHWVHEDRAVQLASTVHSHNRAASVQGDAAPLIQDEKVDFDPVALMDMETFTASSNYDQDRFVEHVQMRTERQTLRRLPKSGAIVFTVRTYIVPVVTMAQEPGVPARLSSALQSWPEDTFKYKGGRKYRGQLVTYLDCKHAEQVAQGLVLDKDQDRAKYLL